MAILENDIIRLRALEPEDLDRIYDWENHAEWWSAGSTLAPYSRFVLKEYIAGAHRDIYDVRQLRLIIEQLDTKEAIGMIDLYDFEPHHKRAGVGILLDPSHQGNGMASVALSLLIDYAFSFLKLHQLYAHVGDNNEASRTLFSRCGFVTTGKLSDWQVTVDGYRDVLVMQLLNGHPR